jgi:hypothetical protein
MVHRVTLVPTCYETVTTKAIAIFGYQAMCPNANRDHYFVRQ